MAFPAFLSFNDFIRIIPFTTIITSKKIKYFEILHLMIKKIRFLKKKTVIIFFDFLPKI